MLGVFPSPGGDLGEGENARIEGEESTRTSFCGNRGNELVWNSTQVHIGAAVVDAPKQVESSVSTKRRAYYRPTIKGCIRCNEIGVEEAAQIAFKERKKESKSQKLQGAGERESAPRGKHDTVRKNSRQRTEDLSKNGHTWTLHHGRV